MMGMGGFPPPPMPGMQQMPPGGMFPMMPGMPPLPPPPFAGGAQSFPQPRGRPSSANPRSQALPTQQHDPK